MSIGKTILACQVAVPPRHLDEVARRDGFTDEELTAFVHRLSRRDRRTLTAYRDGVNAYLREVTLDPTRLPFEFLGVPPAPWRDEDSVAVAILQLVVFGANGGQALLATGRRSAGGDQHRAMGSGSGRRGLGCPAEA